MKKKSIKSYKIDRNEIIYLSLFLVFFVLNLFIVNSNLNINKKFNLNKTNIDYIIPTPSQNQVDQLLDSQYIKNVIPYYYISFSINNVNSLADGYILNSFNDIYNTYVSEDLILSKNNLSNNSIVIDDVFSKKNSIDLGDTLKISYGNITLDLKVDIIFSSDNRHSFGMIFIQKNEMIIEELKNQNSNRIYYSGAFIQSDNLEETKFVIEKYVPLGNLKSRESFSSNELYDIYLDQLNSADYSLQIFDKANYINQMSLETQNQMTFNFVITVILFLITTISLTFIIVRKSLIFMKKSYNVDIKDGYKKEDQLKMITTYSSKLIAIIISISVIIFIVLYTLNLRYLLNHSQNLLFFIFIIMTVLVNQTYLMKAINEFHRLIKSKD